MNKQGIELSYLLRHHKPYQAIISKEGYVATSQILLDMNIVKNVLDDIVKNDPENRFEYSTDKEYIRARNGHSLDVDIEYSKAEIPTRNYDFQSNLTVVKPKNVILDIQPLICTLPQSYLEKVTLS